MNQKIQIVVPDNDKLAWKSIYDSALSEKQDTLRFFENCTHLSETQIIVRIIMLTALVIDSVTYIFFSRGFLAYLIMCILFGYNIAVWTTMLANYVSLKNASKIVNQHLNMTPKEYVCFLSEKHDGNKKVSKTDQEAKASLDVYRKLCLLKNSASRINSIEVENGNLHIYFDNDAADLSSYTFKFREAVTAVSEPAVSEPAIIWGKGLGEYVIYGIHYEKTATAQEEE